jgi:hypothetical protein
LWRHTARGVAVPVQCIIVNREFRRITVRAPEQERPG